MKENKTPVNELIADELENAPQTEIERLLKELEENNPEQYEQIKRAAAQMAAVGAALVRWAAECAKQFIEDFAVNIQPSLDEVAEQINVAWADMYKACEDAKIFTRETLPRPDYGQTPKTITKPYLKPITKSRSRERKQ